MRTLIVTAAAALLFAGTALAQTSSPGSSTHSPSMNSGSSMNNGSSTGTSSTTRHYRKNEEQSQAPTGSTSTHRSTTSTKQHRSGTMGGSKSNGMSNESK